MQPRHVTLGEPAAVLVVRRHAHEAAARAHGVAVRHTAALVGDGQPRLHAPHALVPLHAVTGRAVLSGRAVAPAGGARRRRSSGAVRVGEAVRGRRGARRREARAVCAEAAEHYELRVNSVPGAGLGPELGLGLEFGLKRGLGAQVGTVGVRATVRVRARVRARATTQGRRRTIAA